MSKETPSRFADAEQQIDQLQATLDHVKHALQAADRAEHVARGAAGPVRKGLIVAVVVAVVAVAVKLTRGGGSGD